jgi:copper chaperone CopZ
VETKTIRVPGLNDESSAQQVRHALNEVWGIRAIQEVSLARQEVTFQYDEHASSMRDFEQALLESGFEVTGGDDAHA